LVGTSEPNNDNSQFYTQTGGVIAIVAPFVETVASYANDQIYEVREKQ
jgi:hypothetical protein